MWRVGLVVLFLGVVALSSARIASSERPAITVARAAKADLQHVLQAAAVEPEQTAAESEEQGGWRVAASYAAFENIWAGPPDGQSMSSQSQVQSPHPQWAWAFAPSTLPSEQGPGKLPKPSPDHADNASTRIYVLYGQYGWATSSGMYYLAQSLARYGEVSVHNWDDRTVVQDAKRHPGKVVIIGYSLGANSTVAIANKLPHVDLIVAYDPSRLSPLAHEINGEFTQHVKPTVRRAICFYNPYAWYYGGARLDGSQVELVPITNFHLAVAVDQRLHDITEEAVRQVASATPKEAPEAPGGVVATQPSKPLAGRSAESLSRTAARSDMPNG